jgi:hypothetical protein
LEKGTKFGGLRRYLSGGFPSSSAIGRKHHRTNRVIAQQRGTAERTVANQMQAIYRKLSVRSRVELAGALGAGV